MLDRMTSGYAGTVGRLVRRPFRFLVLLLAFGAGAWMPYQAHQREYDQQDQREDRQEREQATQEKGKHRMFRSAKLHGTGRIGTPRTVA